MDSRQATPNEQILAINLRRMWWLIILTTALSLTLFTTNLILVKNARLMPVVVIDIGLSVTFLVGNWLALRRVLRGAAARWLVYGYALFFLALMNAYYFSLLKDLGQNTTYLFGIMAPAVILLIRPAIFLPMLLLNHLVFCVLLSQSTSQWRNLDLTAAVFESSAVVVLAALANWFLYRSKREELTKSRELFRRNRELLARSEEMDELMAIAAHDLRSPLQSLRDLYLLEKPRLEWSVEPYRDILKTSVAGCESMLKLVNRMLEAHRMEHQLENGPLHVVDLRLPFGETVERGRPAAERKQIRILWQPPSQVAHSVVSPDAVGQVLDNLISNAIKFAPSGSTVEVSLYHDGEGWCGEVADDGPGIKLADQKRLFQKFQRGVNLPTASEESSGLGLFIVERLMSSLGGSVEYVARNPRGSIFRLYFPSEFESAPV